ncbi:putative MFS transporter [Favolaschia claudopus]|uniref:MFS transporter n=1 Tax=Favolaschia claudopus TaxID=2862362 RepID=A0AAW0DCR6_9AGAR
MKSKTESEPGPPPPGTRPTRASTRRKKDWEFGCTAAPDAPIVMSTPELLELILIDVPRLDLLLSAPLVCKTWQATTKTPTIQRLLFFLPDPTIPASERILNPLLEAKLPPFFTPDPYGQGGNWCRVAYRHIRLMPWSKKVKAFTCAEASWRRMLTTQPPTQQILVKEVIYESNNNRERRAFLHAQYYPPLFATMGFVYDVVVPRLDTGSSLLIRWYNDDDSDFNASPEVDVTLDFNCSYMPYRAGRVPRQFYNDAGEERVIEFGEWEAKQ